jgi:hypothetical protein
MKRLLLKISIIFFICVISTGMNLYAGTFVSVAELENSEEYQIGVMVKSIQKALENPETAGSLMTITKYGLDSRYYKMIRGWLLLELSGVESQYEAGKEDSIRQKHALKIEFLKKAIRAIDQE